MTSRKPGFNWVFPVLVLVILTVLVFAFSRTAGEQPAPGPSGPEPGPAVTVQPEERRDPDETRLSLEDSLEPVHPDEPVSYTFHERFSLENALQRVEQINEIGDSALDELDQHGEIRMALPNWIGAVEGTLRKQEYEIRKLEFELALRDYEGGIINEDELEQKERDYERAESDFRIFWDSLAVRD